MIRPELKAQIFKWREVLVALGFAVLFLWGAAQFFGIFKYLLLALALASLFFGFGAFQRARFASQSDGIGMVELDEGVISYLTAQAGGQIEVEALHSVTLIPGALGTAFWELDADGQTPLRVPTDAHNVEVLFDAFIKLPGLETEKMLRQIKETPDQPVVIWKKRTSALH